MTGAEVLSLAAAAGAGAAALALGHRMAVVSSASRRYRLLGEASAAVNRVVLLNEDEGRIYETVLEYALRILNRASLGTVLVLGEDGWLTIAASRGFTEDYTRTFRLRLEDSWQFRQSGGRMAEAAIITPETILKSGYKHDDWTWQYRSVISAPLRVGDRIHGLINIDSRRRRTFGARDLEVLKAFQAQIEVSLLAREHFRTVLEGTRRDALTQVLNRQAFEERLAEALDHASRYGESFTLGMFDVDGLKAVNDRFGHQGGDRILRLVAEALRATARKSDLLGRFGGDEFVAVYQNTDPTAMSDRMEGLLTALAATPAGLDERITASFSFGFAEYPAEAGTAEALVAVADRRLYERKAARNRSR